MLRAAATTARRGSRVPPSQCAQAVQRPERVDRAGVQADRVDRAIANPLDQGGHDVGLAALDQQPLGVHPPELVVVPERGDQPGGVGRIERRRLGGGRPLVDDPVDPPVGLVAQRGLVGGPLAGLEPARRGVVLDDVVVPVDDPDVAVGADLGRDRRGPFVVAGQQVPAVVGDDVAPLALERERGDQVPGRLGDERRLVPVLAGIGPRGVERMAGRRP